jgi:hypothetical protein
MSVRCNTNSSTTCLLAVSSALESQAGGNGQPELVGRLARGLFQGPGRRGRQVVTRGQVRRRLLRLGGRTLLLGLPLLLKARELGLQLALVHLGANAAQCSTSVHGEQREPRDSGAYP